MTGDVLSQVSHDFSVKHTFLDIHNVLAADHFIRLRAFNCDDEVVLLDFVDGDVHRVHAEVRLAECALATSPAAESSREPVGRGVRVMSLESRRRQRCSAESTCLRKATATKWWAGKTHPAARGFCRLQLLVRYRVAYQYLGAKAQSF